MRRWLAADAIKPWRHRSWIFPRDPDFAAKAARVLDLYDRCWDGTPLGRDEYVNSADEKSQLQALRRRHADLPPGPEQARRTEFEYTRGGTLAYLAALDVHHATVIGRCAETTGIAPIQRTGRAGHDPRALRLSPTGVLGWSTTVPPPVCQPGVRRPRGWGVCQLTGRGIEF